nr:ribonuclease H-like domain-containing protein [Tanacetum cinerariifolium]
MTGSDVTTTLLKLLERLGVNDILDIDNSSGNIISTVSTMPVPPVAFHTTPSPITNPLVTPIAHHAQPGSIIATIGSMGPMVFLRQETTLPHAFTVGTLHDPAIGAWNMDTGGSSHLNASVTDLNDVFNMCNYPSVSVLLRCDSTGDLYPVTALSLIPHAFLVSQHTWHQRLGHQESEVLYHLVSHNFISCKEKPHILCHACQLGQYVTLSFVSSDTMVTACFDIIHSDVWTSPISSLSGFKYYVLFLDHYSQFVWVYPLINKSDVLSKFLLFRTYVRTQFKCEIRSFQCDHGGEFDNRNLHKLFADNGIQFRFSCLKTSQQNDDLYNHLKVYESEVQKKSEPNSQNMAFISSAKHSSGNEDGNTACVSTASTNVPTTSASVATISQDTAWKKISIQGSYVAGFDKSKVECFNCHKMGHFERECRAPRSQERGRRDNYRQGSKAEEQAPKALMAIDGVGWDWSYMANDEEDHALFADEVAPIELALMANTSAESKKLETLKEEKEGVDGKLTGLLTASKDLDNLIESQRTSAGRSHYRAPWVPTINRTFPPVNRKFSTGSRNFPTANRKFPTAGSTKCFTADMGMKGKAVKPSACWFWKHSQNLSNK